MNGSNAADQRVVQAPGFVDLFGCRSIATRMESCAEFVDDDIRRRKYPGRDDMGAHAGITPALLAQEAVGDLHGYRLPEGGGRRRTAPRIPRKISSGGGGQPGTVASTGITLATLPQLA